MQVETRRPPASPFVGVCIIDEERGQCTGYARICAEVDAIIPPPGGTSSAGPHLHLLPDHIAQGFDTPPTVPLPDGYVMSALFYPT